jgi:hypothetical protein
MKLGPGLALREDPLTEEEDTPSPYAGHILNVCGVLLSPDDSGVSPSEFLAELYEIGDELEAISSRVIGLLRRAEFFSKFGHFSINVPPGEPVAHFLAILGRFSLFPTEVCVDILVPDLVAFLRTQVFSAHRAVRLLALNCLKNFSEDSDSCRNVICLSSIVPDLSSIVFSSIDPDLLPVSKAVLCALLACGSAATHLNVFRHLSMFLLQTGDYLSAIQMLLFLSEEKHRSLVFLNEGFCRLILKLLSDHHDDQQFMLPCLKFLTIRSEFPDEADVYFRLNSLRIFKGIVDANPMKSEWICWVIGNVLKTVPDSIPVFYELELFEFVESLIVEGEFRARARAVVVLARLIGQNSNVVFRQRDRVLAMLLESVEVLLSGSHRTVARILEMYLAVIDMEMKEASHRFVTALQEDETVATLAGLIGGESEEYATLAREVCRVLEVPFD